MAMGLNDIFRLRNRGQAPMSQTGPVTAAAPAALLGGLGAAGNGGGYGMDLSTLHTPAEAATFQRPQAASPEEEQDILRRFELRQFGPPGTPGNPPIGNAPGDLREDIRNMLLWYFMAGRGGTNAGQVQGPAA